MHINRVVYFIQQGGGVRGICSTLKLAFQKSNIARGVLSLTIQLLTGLILAFGVGFQWNVRAKESSKDTQLVEMLTGFGDENFGELEDTLSGFDEGENEIEISVKTEYAK